MPLEENVTTKTKASELNENWPTGLDPKAEGDDHIRNVKKVLKGLEERTGLDRLTSGSVPAVFGEAMDESGIRLEGGGPVAYLPIALRSPLAEDPRSQTYCPIPFSPLGQDAAPVHFKTGALENVVIQPGFGEVNTGPLVFTFTSSVTGFIAKYFIRGASSEIRHVRVVVRRGDANGPVIQQTASAQEIIEGGGFTIPANNDIEIVLPELWPSSIGTVTHVTFERYDPVTGVITQQGVFVKGSTIGGVFLPYLETDYYPYVLTELLEKGEVVRRKLKVPADVAYPYPITTSHIVLSRSFDFVAGKKYDWRLNITMRSGASNSRASARVLANGIGINVYNGIVGNIDMDYAGQVHSHSFEGQITASTTQSSFWTVILDYVSASPILQALWLTVEEVE